MKSKLLRKRKEDAIKIWTLLSETGENKFSVLSHLGLLDEYIFTDKGPCCKYYNYRCRHCPLSGPDFICVSKGQLYHKWVTSMNISDKQKYAKEVLHQLKTRKWKDMKWRGK